MRIESFAALAIAVAIATVVAFVITGRQAERVSAGAFGTVTVTSPLDADASDFTCTLREAIVAQNTDTADDGCTASGNGPDRIVFNLGPDPVINISAASMPSVTSTVEIDGGPDKVELRGPVSDLFPGYLAGPAIRISGAGASGSVVRGLAINRFGHGIIVTQDASDVQILGNFLGTDASGTVGSGNYEAGIGVQGPNARIGGTNGWQPGGSCTGDCNLFAGHTSGNSNTGLIISSAASNTVVHGNMFSTDPTGLNSIPNLNGIRALGPESLIGGDAPGEGNLFADRFGIHMEADDAVIQGNYFGTDTTGEALLVQDFGVGVIVDGGVGVLVGGTSPGARNVIASDEGLRVIGGAVNARMFGNLIGTAPDGTTPLIPASVDANATGIRIDGAIGTEVGGIDPGEDNVIANRGIGVLVSGLNGISLANQIRGNSIHSNIGLGIETENGGNGEPPPPVITSADQSGATGTASLCAPCAVEVYSDDEDEGRIYEGTTQTDLLGNWTFAGSLTGPNVTAIRTDDGGNSSEFSAPFTIDISTPTPTPSPTPSPTPTPSGQPTPTPTPTGGGQQVAWGDHNCSGSADPVDALLNLRHDAGLPAETNECPEMGEQVEVANASTHIWGDFDCSGAADPVDGLKVLRFDAGLDVARAEGCPDPGETVTIPG